MTIEDDGPHSLWNREITRPELPLLAQQPAVGSRISVVGPAGVVATHWLHGPMRIGRSDECELILQDASVSRTHAVIERAANGAWQVVDTESRNGIWRAGRSHDRITLCENSVTRIGRHFLVYECGDATVGNPMESLAGAHHRTAVSRIDELKIPLLLLGPTGSGKSWLARQLRDRLSPGRPFVALNCAELSPSLVESELFGAEKGAYTGLGHARVGLIEQANGGVLFLDEIGTLTPALQAKLLHVLESGEVRPVGATRWRKVNWNLIAATNQDLAHAVDTGEFRADLYHRLAGRVVHVPSLIARRTDIPQLCDTLFGSPLWARLTPDEHAWLLTHDWPGNVRELAHLMAHPTLDALRAELSHRLSERARKQRDLSATPPPAGTAASTAVPASQFDTDPPDPLRDTAPVSTVPHNHSAQGAGINLPRRRSRPGPKVDRPTRAHLLQLLEKHDDNISAVARELGKGPTQIRRWLGLA